MKLALGIPIGILCIFLGTGCGRNTPLRVQAGPANPTPLPPFKFEPPAPQPPAAVPNPPPNPDPPALPNIPIPPLPSGPMACAIVKTAPVQQAGQPVPFAIFANNPVQTATLNGVPATPGQPLAVAPGLGGTYLVNGHVVGASGQATCQLVFQPPACSITVLEERHDLVRAEMNVGGQVAQVFVDGQPRPLPPTGVIQFSFDPASPGTLRGLVRSAQGDEGRCENDYTFPVTTTAGTPTNFYFTTGASTSGTSAFMMGVGVTAMYGFWKYVPGSSNLPIHTGVTVQRGDACGANEVAVGFGQSSMQAVWAQCICAPLVAALELAESRTVYSPWSPNVSTSCAPGEVLTGTTWEGGADYGQYGGRVAMRCSRIRWRQVP